MRITQQEILTGKNWSDATSDWELHSVPTGSNAAIELDAYGIYVADAYGADMFIREAKSAAEAASIDCDGYGLHILNGEEPIVFVGQWGYDDALHLAASAVTSAGKIRLLKIGSRTP